MSGSVARAWLVGHGAGPTVISMVTVGCLASVYAKTLVPSVAGPLPIPLWVLVPPTLAMFSSLGVSNALPVLRPPPVALVGARLLWLVSVLIIGACAAGLVSAATGYRGLREATVLLIALTYASATVIGRGAVVVGGAVVVVILTHTRAFADIYQDSALLYASLPWHWTAAGVATCGCVGFVFRGARRSTE